MEFVNFYNVRGIFLFFMFPLPHITLLCALQSLPSAPRTNEQTVDMLLFDDSFEWNLTTVASQ
jgi:hypothetical protein